MHTTANRSTGRNSAFAWITLATCSLLLIPIGAMQFTTAVDWSSSDFAVMGVFLFSAGSVFVLVARNVSPKHRVVVGMLVAAALVYVWAELAVGIFTNLGS